MIIILKVTAECGSERILKIYPYFMNL